MSVSSIIDSSTGKIYDNLIPQGGGVALLKGQLITSDGTTEQAFPQVAPADGTFLSYNSGQPLGLQYVAIAGVTPLDYQQILSADNANQAHVIPAPAHNGYVLTADTDPANITGLAWKAVGGSGTLSANTPLIDEEDPVTHDSKLSINFSASVGEIPYGNGTAKEGALTNVPTAGQILGINNGVPTWINAGGSGTITANPPLYEENISGASNIYLGFGGAIGQIPYGNGNAKEGTITNIPTAGQILGMAGTPAVPTWINAGGSGTITALAPLTEYADGNASKVAVDFTGKGDLIVGGGVQVGGNPVAGLILPLGADKQILTVNTKLDKGMEWVDPPTSVNTVIVRSNDATKVIDPPNSNTETLILVAEDSGATWDAEPSSTFGFPSANYAMQYIFVSSNGNEYAVNMEYIQSSGAVTYLTACLYQTYPNKVECARFYGMGNVTPTFICNVYEYAPNNIILMGSFVQVIPLISGGQGFPCYNIAKFDSTTNLIYTPFAQSWGLAPLFQNAPLVNNGSVQGCFSIGGAERVFYGSFNSAMGTSGGSIDDGYLNVAILNEATGAFLSSASTTTALKLGFFKPAGHDPNYPLYVGGEIRSIVQDIGAVSYYVGGDFTNCGSISTNVAIEGMCGYNYTSYVSFPPATSLGASPIIINSMVTSSTINNHLLVCGSITNNISFINFTGGVLTPVAITGTIPPAGQVGGYGCIDNAGFIIPAPAQPAVSMDVVMLFNPSTLPAISTTYYFTVANGTASTVLPATNIIYSNDYMGLNITVNPYLGTITPPPQPTLLALGSNAGYLWDTDVTPTMTFNMLVGKFVNKYTNPPYSNFTMTAGSSQSFIASQSATNWIVTNGITVGGVFS